MRVVNTSTKYSFYIERWRDIYQLEASYYSSTVRGYSLAFKISLVDTLAMNLHAHYRYIHTLHRHLTGHA